MAHNLVISQGDPAEVVRKLRPLLARSESDKRPVALMTCGIAGSGKTTLSKAVLESMPTFQRLSNDEIIAARHGICGVDYEPDKYAEYQDEADCLFLNRLKDLLTDGKTDIILDRSLYAKEDRDRFKQIVEQAGGRWVLVHFRVAKGVLWERICERRAKEVNANSALDISKELFETYVQGFEHPSGEGEVVIEDTSSNETRRELWSIWCLLSENVWKVSKEERMHSHHLSPRKRKPGTQHSALVPHSLFPE